MIGCADAGLFEQLIGPWPGLASLSLLTPISNLAFCPLPDLAGSRSARRIFRVPRRQSGAPA
jgi:hypothetical protein